MANIFIIGGGPAGLMAAETLAQSGHHVSVYERKATLGRKFLMAGRGGLNITHSEDIDKFLNRYGPASQKLARHIRAFSPQHLQKWCRDLGEDTFIGSSGRVFPKSFKASPLLRAWRERMEKTGVIFHMQHEWIGWNKEGSINFLDNQGNTCAGYADAVLLALGGASWPKLGADGGWVRMLEQLEIKVSPLRPANCGFFIPWSNHFCNKFAGTPLKPVTIYHQDQSIRGEIMITKNGIEGGAVYALSSYLRDEIEKNKTAAIKLDLRPGLSVETLENNLKRPRKSQSLSTYLQKSAGLSPVAMNIMREVFSAQDLSAQSPATLATNIKGLPLHLLAPFSIDRSISTAGGIVWDEIDQNFMLKKKPGVFVAGEMIDWEAPTGGYLLQACFATGVSAARGIEKWLSHPQ